MEKIYFRLENTHGIRKLDHTFNFRDSGKKAIVLYASNGVMKSSFARTIKDHAVKRPAKDHRLDIDGNREIKVDDKSDLDPERILVVDSYNESYESERISSLVVSSTLSKEYEAELKNLEKKKKTFINALAKKVNLTAKKTEERLLDDLGIKKTKDLLSLVDKIRESKDFGDLNYNVFSSAKVKDTLNDPIFASGLSDYIRNYEKLINDSPVLRSGFDRNNALKIGQELEGKHYFDANHELVLKDFSIGGADKKISTKKELDELIEKELEKVMENSELKSQWEKIDSILGGHNDLRLLKTYLSERRDLVPELKNWRLFLVNFWYSSLKGVWLSFEEYIDAIPATDVKILKVLEKASKEKTDWESVVELFNSRFFTPFNVEMKNKREAITSADAFEYEFRDDESKEVVEKERMLKTLSEGEKRALYILNVLFEIEGRKKMGLETLIVFDDIADSFDYKNKYALIQYLSDCAEVEFFKIIILTHNFDFFRSVGHKIGSMHKISFQCHKINNEIKIVPFKYIKNPFVDMRKRLNDPFCFFSMIPFVRNLVEFQYDTRDELYINLSNLLHFREALSTQRVSDVRGLLGDYAEVPSCEQDESLYLDYLLKCVSEKSSTGDPLDLEHKISFSIAIRIVAEKYMSKKLNVPECNKLTSQQLNDYKRTFPKSANLKLLEEVCVSTPHDIHLNAFMYEPIIDLGDDHLRKLFNSLYEVYSREVLTD